VRTRLLPLLSIFAGGVVYAVLPRDAFAAYDIATRAALTGAVAGMTCLLILTLRRRPGRSLSQEKR
jgi:O-antigen/teichoic acid export membrane protein